ncbi:Major Facilitator Superfamily transporter [Caldisphaera lagunensis DSM 15908]|uniref:Major Facilitator Superfamily transporter n=1 Tax=Caldisphaera lagunensis (strain DSM 15908 / JCM 11604 / ANMR 0165 / IC-154) TaxID=1056495 RepID=L0A7Z6_CALLD|nr:MFS transporter [Caldisphaera lagunensis]AFZ69993.1 Major Facilitator Superfamily transporter [Caldisphaera lagunensis DSM 15908]
MKENQKKIREYTIISMSISILLYGFSITLGALLTQINSFPKYLDIYLLITPPLSLLLGNILFGRLADNYGRKPILVFTPILFSIGIVLFLIPNQYTTLLGVNLLLFSIAGGDEPAIISYSVENLSSNDRGKVMMLITNFVNIGALISSFIFIIFKYYLIMKITTSSFLFISLLISYILRKDLPESTLWIKSESKKIKDQNLTKISSLLFISISTILTYGLISWVIGPYYYPNLTSYIVLFFNLGNIIGGIIGYLIIDNIKRNSFVFFGFAGGIITSSFLLLAMHLHVNYSIFLPLLITNGIFTQLTWGSRLILEGELFSTKIRASSISLIRGSGWFIYIISTILTVNFTIILFQLYDILFWILGLLGSLIWYLYGIDTRKIPIEKLDKVLS